MGTTSDPNDPRLTRGADETPVPQAEVYLVLSEEERAKGFVRPVRRSYVHVGTPGPVHALRDLTDEEQARFDGAGYLKYEQYPTGSTSLGRFWTQADLNAVDAGCGAVTTMSQDLAETYARQPSFYGSTYCARCQMHRPVGARGEFVWADELQERVGT